MDEQIKAVVERIKKVRDEIRAKGHKGWGNELDDIVATLESPQAGDAVDPHAAVSGKPTTRV